MTAEHYIGQPVQEIDTPALVIDLDVMEDNIARMAKYFAVVTGVSPRSSGPKP